MNRALGRAIRSVAVAAAMTVLVAGCSSAPVSNGGGDGDTSEQRDAGAATEPERSDVADEAALAVTERLVEALNAGDADAAREQFAPDARFDSVGRIYADRDEIFARFLEPEVIAVGGRYEVLDAWEEDDRIVVEYDFATGSGGREHFTYAYRFEDGLIVDVVGRYV